MIPDVSTGAHTRGLLAYLYGPGRRDEHFDPHIVGAWAMTGLPDPGRDPDTTLTELAAYLDQPVKLRARETGTMPPQHVWHCPVRTAPGDRYLSDAEWGEVARRVVHAAGIAPDGDEMACRWIAVRHAHDHIHIVATTVREDGRRPRNKRDGMRAQAECRRIEKQLGLRQLKQGDYTAAPTPTSAEQAKALRRGRPETAREWLRGHVRTVASAAKDEAEFFSTLTALGIQVKTRIGPETGDIIGYAVAQPGDVNNQGEPVWYSGTKLAPDLSINRIRERLAAQEAPDRPTASTTRPANPWHTATETVDGIPAILNGEDDAAAQAQLAAFGELLDAAATITTGPTKTELRAAAKAFEHATRSKIRADHQHASHLRHAAKQLFRTTGQGDGEGIAILISSLVLVAIAAANWHNARHHEQQTAATHQALLHLQAAHGHAASRPLADLTRRTPPPEITHRYETALRQAVPDHAERILADPTWPALSTALADADASGHKPAPLLKKAAELQELDTAKAPAQVMIWRLKLLGHHPAPNTRVKAARSRSTTPTKPAPITTQPPSAKAQATPPSPSRRTH